MRIAVVGGMLRQEGCLVGLAAASGHVLEFHSGFQGKRGGDLRTVIARSDVVLIVTDLVSHGGARLARTIARQLDRPARLVSRLGTSRLQIVIEELAVHGRASP